MKLTRVEFIKYKSISGDGLEIEDDITCLVGINESGKSNILLALAKADTEEKLTNEEISRHSEDYANSEETPELKLFFEVTAEEKTPLEELFGNKVSKIILSNL